MTPNSKINLGNIPSKTRALLEKIAVQDFANKFYLAGGTALALFLNHRISVDLDFFSEEKFYSPSLIKNLKKLGTFRGLKSSEDTILGTLNGVKISFFALPYKLLEKPAKFQNLRIANLTDLALMKILAISDRGTKRDFIDLYFLCQNIKPLENFVYLFPKKYGKYDYNIYHIIKSLSYFGDAENDEMPKMKIEISWNSVKKFFISEKPLLAKKILRL
jgi:predicted nucleotidyltransferase component of viral defense system